MWDNLGFDGPKTYRDLGYDVAYANVPGGTSINGEQEINVGYVVGGGQGPRTFTLTGVDWAQTPTKAKVVFNAYTQSSDNQRVTVQLNGKTIGSTTIGQFAPKSVAIDLPAGDAVKGTNKLTFDMPNGAGAITNASLIMVAGAPVP